MNNKKGQIIWLAIIIVLLTIIGVLSVKLISNNRNSIPTVRDNKQETGFAKFSSKQDFISKIIDSQDQISEVNADSFNMISQGFPGPNVQVIGIDKPDIVKTDGKRIFYSLRKERYVWEDYPLETEFINTSLSNFSIYKELKIGGDLLLSKNELILFSSKDDESLKGYNEISGYNKDDGNKLWEMTLNNNTIISAAGVYNDKLYIVLRNHPPTSLNQPIMPLMNVNISPSDIYYPLGCKDPLDTLYSIFEINPDTGDIERNFNLITGGATTIYISKNNIYIALHYRKSDYILFKRYFLNNQKDFPSSLIKRIKEIDSYNISYYISDSFKLNELERAVREYVLSLNQDDQRTFAHNLQNFLKQHEKELDITRIMKISLDDLKLKKSTDLNGGGELSQYSMDEYNNYLRIAMTGGYWNESDNILYILDDNLNVVGKTENFGTTENIHAVMFVGDKGYVATYRNTDPLFIMDLTNVKNPQIVGEVKIGELSSSYIHPINNNLIIGIGKENRTVKILLLNISNPKEPKELSNFLFNKYWNDEQIKEFLIDKKHKIFFVPIYDAGYIFSYDNNKLKLVKTVKEKDIEKALLINNYLYLITDSKIVVLDENTWKEVKELTLFES